MKSRMVSKKKREEIRKEKDMKLFAFLATFLSIVGFVIALIVKRDDSYVMYYAKQSLVIFVIGFIAGIVGNIFAWIPIMGELIRFALGILMFVVWVISWVNALSGKNKKIPIVSYWSKRIDL